MATYWDASCLVPLIVKEATTGSYAELARDTGVTTWWGSYVECAAAVARHVREGSGRAELAESYRLLAQLSEEWTEISANEQLRRAAVRAARNYSLRSGDALQFGAAMLAGGFEPHHVRFLTRDVRLKQAAEREGFVVE